MDQREPLKNFYLFTDVTSSDLQPLEAIVERKAYIAGDLVYREGEVADVLSLVGMGRVDIVPKGKERVFAMIGSGHGFGEQTGTALLRAHERRSAAECPIVVPPARANSYHCLGDHTIRTGGF